MLFWRSFSHWLGGMGILVLILSFIPESKDGSTIHIMRAESTGPQVGKLVSKVKITSRILYLIYLTITVIEFIFLLLGPDKKYRCIRKHTFIIFNCWNWRICRII